MNILRDRKCSQDWHESTKQKDTNTERTLGTRSNIFAKLMEKEKLKSFGKERNTLMQVLCTSNPKHKSTANSIATQKELNRPQAPIAQPGTVLDPPRYHFPLVRAN